MPDALLRACSWPGGCAELVVSGRCPAHTTQAEQRRGSAHSRGYTRRWEKWKAWFIGQLIAAGVLPVCGARWPGEPTTGDSQCQALRRLNDRRLHLDHTPPLTKAERAVESVVCNVRRVQLLCETCHNAKTARERAHGPA